MQHDSENSFYCHHRCNVTPFSVWAKHSQGSATGCGLQKGELQTNFKKEGYNFVNLLIFQASLPLGKAVMLHAKSISTVSTNEEHIIPDLQLFYNLEADNPWKCIKKR